MASVLIVDDEANIRRMVARLLESDGYTARQAAGGQAALDSVAADEPDALLLDLAMPDVSGLEVLERLRSEYPALPIIMMSGRASLADAVRATRLGAYHFIEKPLAPEAVLLTLKGALELRRARDLSRALAAELGADSEMVGCGPAMQRVRELIQQVAPTDARVLLTGESGTGKELAAAAVHGLSRRAGGPFVRVNSAAIPRELVESEMFGHERGAFTGATERRLGRFELADGGTLFLDEVGDLSAEAQAKLLRVLESGEVQRVGGQHPIRVDVRVIAATNRDLETETAAGRFRADLFYRLNVVPIAVPPLRERLEDLSELVQHLLDRLQHRHGLVPPRLGDDAFVTLRRYHWPGNVRELANICERLSILYAGREVGAAEIATLLPDPAGAGAAGESGSNPLSDRLDEFERSLIRHALAESAGNLTDAARRLQTDRPNLYRRMKRLGLER